MIALTPLHGSGLTSHLVKRALDSLRVNLSNHHSFLRNIDPFLIFKPPSGLPRSTSTSLQRLRLNVAHTPSYMSAITLLYLRQHGWRRWTCFVHVPRLWCWTSCTETAPHISRYLSLTLSNLLDPSSLLESQIFLTKSFIMFLRSTNLPTWLLNKQSSNMWSNNYFLDI